MRTEEEQVEALRQWWKDNGTSTLTMLFLAIAAGFGWQAWQAHQVSTLDAASDSYQAMVRLAENGGADSADEVLDIATKIKSEYGSSTYAEFAALRLAAAAVEAGELAEAEAQLRWVLAKAEKGSESATVAQLRLARVLASAGDEEQALAILAQTDAGAYAASYAVARGDILFTRGDLVSAREAYNEAMLLSAAAGSGLNLPSLRQKLQSLASVTAPAQPVPEEAQP
jgi:predicted negative regulator of RcsB-dependent stress response